MPFCLHHCETFKPLSFLCLTISAHCCSFPSKTQKTDKQNPKKSGEMFHLSEAPHRFYHV